MSNLFTCKWRVTIDVDGMDLYERFTDKDSAVIDRRYSYAE